MVGVATSERSVVCVLIYWKVQKLWASYRALPTFAMASTSMRGGRRTILVVGDLCDVNAGPLNTLPQWGVNAVSP